ARGGDDADAIAAANARMAGRWVSTSTDAPQRGRRRSCWAALACPAGVMQSSGRLPMSGLVATLPPRPRPRTGADYPGGTSSRRAGIPGSQVPSRQLDRYLRGRRPEGLSPDPPIGGSGLREVRRRVSRRGLWRLGLLIGGRRDAHRPVERAERAERAEESAAGVRTSEVRDRVAHELLA